METTLPLQPDMRSLSAGLRSVLRVSRASELTILDRERNPYSSGSLSEIVTCRLADGRELRLLFKYAQYPDGRQPVDEPFTATSWSNVPYEAEVYRHVLEPLQLSTPRFYGAYNEPGTCRLWLVLEYIEDAVALDELAEPSYLRLAASWLGRFHSAAERRLAATSLPFLKKLDVGHYSVLPGRALLHAGKIDRSFSWLPDLCRRFEEFVASIWALRPTITHGDYYLNNILSQDGKICPVDWEHAAIDLGEMDLACLTDGWPAEIVHQCEDEYQEARWPQGSPDDVGTLINAARLGLRFDEIGHLPNWTQCSKGLALGPELRSLGERLGLI